MAPYALGRCPLVQPPAPGSGGWRPRPATCGTVVWWPSLGYRPASPARRTLASPSRRLPATQPPHLPAAIIHLTIRGVPLAQPLASTPPSSMHLSRRPLASPCLPTVPLFNVFLLLAPKPPGNSTTASSSTTTPPAPLASPPHPRSTPSTYHAASGSLHRQAAHCSSDFAQLNLDIFMNRSSSCGTNWGNLKSGAFMDYTCWMMVARIPSGGHRVFCCPDHRLTGGRIAGLLSAAGTAQSHRQAAASDCQYTKGSDDITLGPELFSAYYHQEKILYSLNEMGVEYVQWPNQDDIY